MIAGNVNCPVTTSLGRIFDAAAAILGLVDHTSYEGEGPIRLEGKGLMAGPGAGRPCFRSFPVPETAGSSWSMPGRSSRRCWRRGEVLVTCIVARTFVMVCPPFPVSSTRRSRWLPSREHG